MCLIADSGGTNARFALVEEGSISPQQERTLACANYRTLVDAVLAYLEDASAEEAVAMFCGILGSIAGNLALTLGARGGVFVGGGMVPKLGDYFETSPFRTCFESKGRFSKYLSEIPTNVITSKYPALTGAAVAVQQQYDHLGATSASS